MSGWSAYAAHVNPVLGDFLKLTGRDLKLVKAKGGVLEDAEGRKYDDWVSGFGSFNLGHNAEVVKEAVREHLESDAPNLFVENLNPFAGELAEALVQAAGPGFGTAFFCNSGTEAIEAGIKTAILATGRKKVAYADGGYHGTTLGALACMAKGPYRRDFEGVLAEFPEVPFGDLASLEAALAKGDVAAFVVEPVQVESGVRIATDAYLRGARDLCRRHGALLLLDEVQTGMGRTGRLFAYQGAGVAPDMVAVAKSLGGGLVPIGACVMRAGLFRQAYGGYLRCEIHNSTFGGNAIGCRVALKTLNTIAAPAFLEEVRRRAERLFDRLTRAIEGCRAVKAVRWKGLLGGIQLSDVAHPWLKWESFGMPELAGHPIAGALVVERLSRRGILAQVCGHDWSVLRVEPPLTVTDEAIERFVDAAGEAVRWLGEHA